MPDTVISIGESFQEVCSGEEWNLRRLAHVVHDFATAPFAGSGISLSAADRKARHARNLENNGKAWDRAFLGADEGCFL